MTINFWTLGLQAINVIILIWLLTRVFWKPIAAAIAARQAATQGLLDAAADVQAKADAALAEVTKARDGISAERTDTLAEAATQAEASAVLAVTITSKLLVGLDKEVVQTAFLARLVAGIAAMAPQDRAALVAIKDGIDLVSPGDLEDRKSVV